jgi:hypothetical protein
MQHSPADPGVRLDAVLARVSARYRLARAREEDLDEVVALFRETWADPREPEELKRRFRYRYRENPNGGAGDGLWTCRSREGALVGFAGMIDTVVRDGARPVAAAYCADAVVAPAHRGLGVPHLLQREMNRRRDLVLEGNLNADARRLAEQCGARNVGACSVLRRWTLPSDLRWGGRRALHLTAVDGRFDRLWEETRDAYRIAALRDAATLSWRFERNPARRFEIHVAAEGDAIRAYAVTSLGRFRGPLRRGVLVDFLFAPGTPSAWMRDFFREVLGRLARRGALVTDALATHPPERSALEGLGFRSKGHDPGYMVYETPATAGSPHLWSSDAWHFTLADSDLHL